MAKRTAETATTKKEHEYIPFLSWRFDAALQFASGLHHRQPRKGCYIPYIAHLMTVCALVLESGGDEDQAIAALLHDAVEDQGGIPTLNTIQHMFGERVAGIVESCSDSTVERSRKETGMATKEGKIFGTSADCRCRRPSRFRRRQTPQCQSDFVGLPKIRQQLVAKIQCFEKKTSFGTTAHWSALCRQQQHRRPSWMNSVQ